MSDPTGVAADATGAIYEVDQTAARVQRFGGAPPDTPVVTAANPVGPANDNHPLVTGTATAGSTVNLYDNSACTGAPIGTGTAEDFAGAGIAATVPDDSITQIYAQATNGVGSSACSSTSVGYEEISTLRWHVHFDAASASVSEAAGSITVTVSRSGVTDGTASVQYATADGTAGPADYGAVSGTLTFRPGEASKTIDIPIINDQSHEADETFTIALSNPGLGTDTDAPATETVTILDDDPIDTAITDGPSGPTNVATPTFAFTADPPDGATFACAIDGGAAVACGSPWQSPKLPDGPHTLSVAASTPGGAPIRRRRRAASSWTPWRPRPASTCIRLPASARRCVPACSPARSASAPPAPIPPRAAASHALGCSVDPPTAPATADAVLAGSCAPVTAPGAHVVYAVAVDAAGNVGPIAKATFQIVPAPDTTITSGPDGVSWTTTPTFTFTSNDPSATFRCRVDGGAEVVCKSPYTIPAVKGSGAHSITVTAVNSAGLADPSPARRDFRVGETETHKLQCGLSGFPVIQRRTPGTTDARSNPPGKPAPASSRRVSPWSRRARSERSAPISSRPTAPTRTGTCPTSPTPLSLLVSRRRSAPITATPMAWRG